MAQELQVTDATQFCDQVLGKQAPQDDVQRACTVCCIVASACPVCKSAMDVVGEAQVEYWINDEQIIHEAEVAWHRVCTDDEEVGVFFDSEQQQQVKCC